jgi:alanyl-tRNA synthetase
MTSDSEGSPFWTAKRVRDTFLDYFRQNGHTFGMFLGLFDGSSSIN